MTIHRQIGQFLLFISNLGVFPGTGLVWNSCLEHCERWKFLILDDTHGVCVSPPSERYPTVSSSAADDKGWAEHGKSQERNSGDRFIPPHHPPSSKGDSSFRTSWTFPPSCCFQEPYLNPRWSLHLCEHRKYVCAEAWTLTSDKQPLSAADAWQFSSLISHLMTVGTHFPVLHTHSSTAATNAAACSSHYKVYPPAKNVHGLGTEE